MASQKKASKQKAKPASRSKAAAAPKGKPKEKVKAKAKPGKTASRAKPQQKTASITPEALGGPYRIRFPYRSSLSRDIP